MVEDDAVTGLVDEVHAVIHGRAEQVEVLAVQGGDEGGIDEALELVVRVVSRVLLGVEGLAKADALLAVGGDDLLEDIAGDDETTRGPREKVEERLVIVAGVDAHGMAPCWSGRLVWPRLS